MLSASWGRKWNGTKQTGKISKETTVAKPVDAAMVSRLRGIAESFKEAVCRKDVTFRVDYTVSSIGREFRSVFLEDNRNVALLVISEGWGKVKEQGQKKGEASPFLSYLRGREEQTQQQDLGCWNRTLGASEAAIRDLPLLAMCDPSEFDKMGLLASHKGSPMQAIVEHIRDGSTLRVYLLPEFKFVQVFVAGIQAPSMGRRAAPEPVVRAKRASNETNGKAYDGSQVPMKSAQRLAASSASSAEVAPDLFARDWEAKHFTEVRFVLEGVDKSSNLIGSVYYPEDETAKDLAMELVENV